MISRIKCPFVRRAVALAALLPMLMVYVILHASKGCVDAFYDLEADFKIAWEGED